MSSDIDPKSVHGSWVRSPEEDTATEIVFRPPFYPFPPSRGREGMLLSPDGTLTRTASGPTDLASHRSGRWHLEAHTLHLDTDDGERRAMQLVEASHDRIVAKR